MEGGGDISQDGVSNVSVSVWEWHKDTEAGLQTQSFWKEVGVGPCVSVLGNPIDGHPQKYMNQC